MTDTQQAPAGPETALLIVGIGASAGGLAAFEAFFSAMPPDLDPMMAFVLVQHLAPDHESILGELIQRYTRLKVYEVEDGMTVKPNGIHIIPPGRDMRVVDGTLRLLEQEVPRRRPLPIDFFFESLAADQRERAIGIVLSGTGTDGTRGIRAIKDEGGLVMAQRLGTTDFEGMPLSVLATGLVDFELAPEEMPAQLIEYATHAFRLVARPSIHSGADSALSQLLGLIQVQTGHDFSEYKRATVRRRVDRRMAILQIDAHEDYIRYLQQSPPEVEALFQDLLIGVTRFFRDPKAFEGIEHHVIPAVFDPQRDSGPVRVWTPGCSTGEEAYSLAMMFTERQQRLRKSFPIKIFATDIDSRAIKVARSGVYPASIAADVSEERLDRFFTRVPRGAQDGTGPYRVHKSIRDLLIFSEQSLIKDPPFSKLDLISCRNVMIYMNAALQKRLIPLFHYALKPGGFLLLGTSESVSGFSDLFTAVDRKLKLYRRRESPAGHPQPSAAHFLGHGHVRPIVPLHPRPGALDPQKNSVRQLADQAILNLAVPAAALVGIHGDILYIHGRTGMYLEPAPGEAGVNNILAMARDGLRRPLTTALHKAVAGVSPVESLGLLVKTNGDRSRVDLTVHRVSAARDRDGDEQLFLVVLERSRVQAAPTPSGAENTPSLGDRPHTALELSQRIKLLERELDVREQYVLATSEKLRTSNEDLSSSNEELQSTNEELQSTNEELQTSKEELQSVNEELSTVNSELETKVSDLSRANSDMNNLLAGTGIATLFVDTKLRIMRFTPTAEEIIHLIPGDTGRFVGHVVTNLVDYAELAADAREVLETLAPKKREVQTVQGRWFAMTILPYRTLDNLVEGVVFTFVDISEEMALKHVVREHEQRLQMALEASGLTLFSQDLELRYTWVSQPGSGYPGEDAIGKTDHDLLPKPQADALSAIKAEVLESGHPRWTKVQLLMGRELVFNTIAVEPVYDSSGSIVGITCATGPLLELTEMDARSVP